MKKLSWTIGFGILAMCLGLGCGCNPIIPAITVVPNVVGQTQAAAGTTIVGANLILGAGAQQCSNTVAVGLVVSQSPAAAALAAPASAVALVISTGPCNVPAPNVVGQTLSAAGATLTGGGVTTGTITYLCSDILKTGLVISENPPAGTLVASGSAVNLVVSAGPCPVVPDVAGMTQAAAGTAITGVNMIVGTVTQQCSATVAAGLVISQSPLAGSPAAPGSAVDLVLSTGPCAVPVPDVVNQTETGAGTTLTGSGLGAGAVTQQCSNTVAAGLVISETPPAGTLVAPGTLVALVVSTGLCNAIVLPGNVPLEMVFVPCGSFMMGRYSGEQGSFSLESPQHQVTIANGFWLGKYELTQAQWLAVVGSNPSSGTGNLQRPVETVSWNAVTQTFLPALNTATGLTFRLPSEAEWEYACRAGNQTPPTRYYWGDDPGSTQIGTYAWYVNNSGLTTHAVGTAGTTGHPNAFGLYDMNGNVAEWCQDWFHSGYSGAPVDGSAWELPVGTGRVARGGTLNDTAAACRSAARMSFNPVGAGFSVGFRVAISTALCDQNTVVPDVVGQTQTAGGTTLGGVNLTTGTVTQQCSNTVATGLVISETPPAGTLVAPGSAVSLVVSTGPCLVTVPDVVGQTQTTGGTTITGTNLTVGTVTQQCSNTVASGLMISQTPTAGQQVPFGSAVALVISTGLCNVTVPDVVGQTQTAGGATLTGTDLTTGTVTQQCSNTVASGLVISQTPTAGQQVPFGSAVALVISTGLCNVTVPDVVGQTQTAGGTTLTGADLSTGTVTQQCSNTVASGLVISQTPTAGLQVPFGSAVALVISTGLCDVTVPDVVGQTQTAGGTTLSGADLITGTVTQQCSNTVASGLVISQTPAAGQQVPFGSAVALVISTGLCNVTVPDVVGQTQTAGGTTLSGADLTTGTVTQQCSNTVASGLVISQTPAAGTQAPFGSAVALVISTGLCDVTVPDVVGQTETEADTTLTGVTLTTGTITEDCSDTVAAGLILSQSPAAGALAAPGSAVAVVLSSGPCSVITLPGDVPLEMVFVPCGSFVMGSPNNEMERSVSEGPQHPVTLKGFWMGKYELTKRQWQAVMGAMVTPPWAGQSSVLANLDSPAVFMSWDAAQTFLTALNNYTGRTFRLPSEAEWEYACRAGTPTRFYWSDDPGDTVIDAYAWYYGNAFSAGQKYAHLVGGKTENSFGLYDMNGNAWEWVQDWYHSSYIGAPSDGSAWETPIGSDRVVRGGSWSYFPGNCRSATRLYGSQTFADAGTGFRLAFSTDVCNADVPDVVGHTEAEAGTALTGANLTTGTVTEECSDTVAAGLIVSQSPAAGTVAAPGSAVDLVLSTGPCDTEMLSVPAGTFTMGNSGVGDDATYMGFPGSPELPTHSVALGAYQIGKHHITNKRYCGMLNWALAQGYLKDSTNAAWAGVGDIYAGGSLQIIVAITSPVCNIQYSAGVFYPKTRIGLPGATIYPMDTHPVVWVSWYGSAAFCNWLSQMQGLTPCYDMTAPNWPLTVAPPTLGGYRLPTEAEWERAAAWDGAKHWVYGFLSDTNTGNTRCNYWSNPDPAVNPLGLTAYPYTSPVGWFDGVNVSPNGGVTTVNSVSPVGAYDMSGNVRDWCCDWFSGTYYSGGAMTNPTGPATGTNRIQRGGSWGAIFYDCRSAVRLQNTPVGADDNCGFRLAMSN